MGKGIVVIIVVVTYELRKRYELGKLRYEIGKLRYELGKIPLITLAPLHAATIRLDSSLKRAERNKTKMMTTIPFPICNLFHLWIRHSVY
jgi:hypothetical protein